LDLASHCMLDISQILSKCRVTRIYLFCFSVWSDRSILQTMMFVRVSVKPNCRSPWRQCWTVDSVPHCSGPRATNFSLVYRTRHWKVHGISHLEYVKGHGQRELVYSTSNFIFDVRGRMAEPATSEPQSIDKGRCWSPTGKEV
jgi:hypothetical protein